MKPRPVCACGQCESEMPRSAMILLRPFLDVLPTVCLQLSTPVDKYGCQERRQAEESITSPEPALSGTPASRSKRRRPHVSSRPPHRLVGGRSSEGASDWRVV